MQVEPRAGDHATLHHDQVSKGIGPRRRGPQLLHVARNLAGERTLQPVVGGAIGVLARHRPARAEHQRHRSQTVIVA